jgi:hypothetical protein
MNMSPRINHRRRNLAEYALLVFLLFVLILLPGCDFVREKIDDFKLPKGIDLDFERPNYALYLMPNYTEFQIHVITESAASLPEHLKWLSLESQDRFLSIDYSRYFLLQIMMGEFGSTGFSFKIKRIWQDKNNIYIKSEFTMPEPGAAYGQMITYPGAIVIVDKEKMSQFGELEFTVFEQHGLVLGKATHYIPAYYDKK